MASFWPMKEFSFLGFLLRLSWCENVAYYGHLGFRSYRMVKESSLTSSSLLMAEWYLVVSGWV